jgi:hypothetical protein
MQNYYNDEEIVEDIQIEEDEYEDENNNKNTTTNNEDNTEEDLIYEDEYESVKDEILKSMSLLSSHKESLSIKNLQQKNKNKMNKLSLLLSQKFLNILCSILSCYIKKNFKIFLNNMKSLIIYRYNMINLSSKNKIKNKKQMNNKTYNNYSINNRIKSSKPNINNNANNNLYKVPKYYLESLKKQEERKMKKELIKKKHEEIKKKKINEEKKKEKEKTETEIEYEKYQYQKKLEKYNEQERKKYLDDLIKKENYADNIYKFIKKKEFFTHLKFNLEIRKVVNIFLTNLSNKMIKINGIKTMVKVRKFLEEKRIKKEKLDNLNADMFYKNKLKQKIFAYLLKYKNITTNEEQEMLKKFEVYKKRKILEKLKKSIRLEFLECKEKKDIIINRHLYFIKKKMFYVLIHFAKAKRDEKIKEDIMFKLRNKANELLKNYE